MWNLEKYNEKNIISETPVIPFEMYFISGD